MDHLFSHRFRICSTFGFIAFAYWASPLGAQVVVPAGFAADQLVGRLDNTIPRIEAIRNPLFGSGVVAASVSNGILTIRRISDGQVTVIGTKTIALISPFVEDLRFDTTGAFGGALFVSVVQNTTRFVTELVRLDLPGGPVSTVTTFGNSNNNGIGLTLDFTSAQSGFAPGCYLYDIDGSDGTSYWRLPATGTPSQLSNHIIYPGRLDMDVRGIEFDRAGAYGGGLVLVDCDANESGLGGAYSLNSAQTWSLIIPQTSTNTLYLRDLAIGAGGALGNSLFVLEARGNRVASISPAGLVSTFASGFSIPAEYDYPNGASSLSISDDGDTLFVSDYNGVYRIRLLTNVPGPVLIAREPSPINTGPFISVSPIATTRLIWSAPVTFAMSDVTVTNSQNQSVSVSASGSGSAFMLIAFGTPLVNDSYTIVIHDSAHAANGAQIDGDSNGISGGNLVFTMTHRYPADLNLDGHVNGLDVQAFVAQLLAP